MTTPSPIDPFSTLLFGGAVKLLEMLMEAGYDQARDVYRNLTHADEKDLRKAFEKAWFEASTDKYDESLKPLLAHRPFQDAVVTGLLDPIEGFDVEAAREVWQEKYPQYERELKMFFHDLQKILLRDPLWRPFLEATRDAMESGEAQDYLERVDGGLTVRKIVADVNMIFDDHSIHNNGTIEQSVIVTGGQFSGNIYFGKSTRNTDKQRKIYCEWVKRSTSHMYLQGLIPGAGTTDTVQKQVELADLYIDLDILKTTRNDDRIKSDRITGNQITVLDVLIIYRKMVLLGEPGSGKTTFTRFVSHCLACYQLEKQAYWLKRLGSVPDSWQKMIPLMITLRDFVAKLPKTTSEAQVSHLENFVRNQLKNNSLSFVFKYLKDCLENGHMLVILDGLDEVSNVEQRLFILEAVRAFIERYPKNHFLLTCRVLSYQPPKNKDIQDLRLTEFPDFTLAPFNEEKIRLFIDTWYREIGKPEKAESLKQALSKMESRLSDMASNPLLLTVMAGAHVYLGTLPDERVSLYKAVVDLLMYRWDDQKFGEGQENSSTGLTQLLKDVGMRKPDLILAIAQLTLEAHAVSQAGIQKLADIEDGKLLRKLESLCEKGGLTWAGKVIEVIQQRAGLLVERMPGVYTFPHRTFQEYMVGVALASTADYVQQVKEKAPSGDNWRLPIVLSAGYMDQVKEELEKVLALVDELCPDEQCDIENDWRNAWLAGDILLEVGVERCDSRHLGKTILSRVRNCLANLLEAAALTPIERARAGDTLARLGDPRFAPDWYYLPKEDLLGFVRIPAGEFIMGSDPKVDEYAEDDELIHKVSLPEFYMAKYPVTVAQFNEFIKCTGYNKMGKPPTNDVSNLPVRDISWLDAVAYCRWLQENLCVRTDLIAELSEILKAGWQITLSSEAEWEKAARGVDGRIYPWGDKFDANQANTEESGIGKTSAVGCFQGAGTPYGLFDMSGNVWEWTRSHYKEYPYRPQDGREKMNSKGRRVLRGCGFFIGHKGGRCASRGGGDLGYHLDDVGFRVVVVSPIHTSDL